MSRDAPQCVALADGFSILLDAPVESGWKRNPQPSASPGTRAKTRTAIMELCRSVLHANPAIVKKSLSRHENHSGNCGLVSRNISDCILNKLPTRADMVFGHVMKTQTEESR